MQDNVDIYTRALISVIRDSREYREYCAARRKVEDDPALKKQINDYRRDTYRLQTFCDEESLYDKVQEFNAQYAQFRKDPLVNEYLSSELAVCRMLQKISASIVDSVDLDLDDVAKELRR